MNKNYFIAIFLLFSSNFLYLKYEKDKKVSFDPADIFSSKSTSRMQNELNQLKEINSIAADADQPKEMRDLASKISKQLLQGIENEHKKGVELILAKAVAGDADFKGSLFEAIASEMFKPVGKKLNEAGTAVVEKVWGADFLDSPLKSLGMKPLVSSEELEFVKTSAKSIRNVLKPLKTACGKGGDDLLSLNMREASSFAGGEDSDLSFSNLLGMNDSKLLNKKDSDSKLSANLNQDDCDDFSSRSDLKDKNELSCGVGICDVCSENSKLFSFSKCELHEDKHKICHDCLGNKNIKTDECLVCFYLKQVVNKFPVKIMLTNIALDLENALGAFCKRLSKYKKKPFTPLGMAYKRMSSSLSNIQALKKIFSKAQSPNDLVKSGYYEQILCMSDSISESCDNVKPLLGLVASSSSSSRDRYSGGFGGYGDLDY